MPALISASRRWLLIFSGQRVGEGAALRQHLVEFVRVEGDGEGGEEQELGAGSDFFGRVVCCSPRTPRSGFSAAEGLRRSAASAELARKPAAKATMMAGGCYRGRSVCGRGVVVIWTLQRPACG